MPWQQKCKSVIIDDPFAFVFVFKLNFLSCLELLNETVETRKPIYSEVPSQTKHYCLKSKSRCKPCQLIKFSALQ